MTKQDTKLTHTEISIGLLDFLTTNCMGIMGFDS
jgi:hypothetical protein